jgi:hypothetical protein
MKKKNSTVYAQCGNIRITAHNNQRKPGFNIFLDFSGRLEFLMWHRHNGLLYLLLKKKPNMKQLMDYRAFHIDKDDCGHVNKSKLNNTPRCLWKVSPELPDYKRLNKSKFYNTFVYVLRKAIEYMIKRNEEMLDPPKRIISL